MSKQVPPITLSETDIRATYVQGEEAVVSLVTQLMSRLAQLEARVNELEGRVSKTSRNSNKPTSSDGFGKRTKSLRGKSDQASGGQRGHRGETLEWLEHPEAIERHEVQACSGCGASLREEPVEQVFSR